MMKEIKKYFSDKMNMEVKSVENISPLNIKNSVYRIQAGDRYFILKTFFRKDKTTLRRSKTEAEVLKRYGDRSPLIPKLYFEDFSYGCFDFPIICTSYVEGSDSKYKVKSEINASENNLSLIKNSISAIDSIHTLEISNVPGTLFAPYEGSFIDFVINEKDLGLKVDYNFLNNSLMKISNGDRILRNYVQGKNLTIPKEFCLCHNDLSGHEILIDDGKVNGIVDWEQAVISDPVGDFAAYIFSFLNSAYSNKNLQRATLSKILPFLKNEVIGSLSFHLAERAMIISLAYYVDYKPEKFEWSMKLTDNLLSNPIQDMNSLIDIIIKTD